MDRPIRPVSCWTRPRRSTTLAVTTKLIRPRENTQKMQNTQKHKIQARSSLLEGSSVCRLLVEDATQCEETMLVAYEFSRLLEEVIGEHARHDVGPTREQSSMCSDCTVINLEHNVYNIGNTLHLTLTSHPAHVNDDFQFLRE